MAVLVVAAQALCRSTISLPRVVTVFASVSTDRGGGIQLLEHPQDSSLQIERVGEGSVRLHIKPLAISKRAADNAAVVLDPLIGFVAFRGA